MKKKNQLTLHEAMIKIIEKTGSIKAPTLAWLINTTKLYEKRDLSEIKPSQIYARMSKYPHLFYINSAKEVCIK